MNNPNTKIGGGGIDLHNNGSNSAKYNTSAPPPIPSSSSLSRFQSSRQQQQPPPPPQPPNQQQQSLHSISNNIDRVSNSLSSLLPQQMNHHQQTQHQTQIQPIQHQPNGTIEISPQHLSEMLILLQNIQIQIKKLVQYQDQTYQWNLKHHENMKKVIKSFNNLNAIMRQKNQSPNSSMEINNPISNRKTADPDNTATTSNTTNKKPSKGNNIVCFEKDQRSKDLDLTYHQMIMDCYNERDPYSIDLQQLVQQLDYDSFMELKEKSIKIILPIILLWMKESIIDNSKISLSLIILYMTLEKFTDTLKKKKYKEVLSQFGMALKHLEDIHVIDEISKLDMFPFTFEEYSLLKKFLSQHQSTDQQLPQQR